MPTERDEISSSSAKCNDVIYSINSYEDTRHNANKPASNDSSEYIQKVRVTRAIPPKPAYDPLQFVQLKPCNLVKTAQEQAKKAETVKKIQEEKKEEPEEWQCNLDNWKSSRRKRVEHIIDRVVEVKKLELEEHDRNRRKSKTFNEMMEERGSRRLKPLPIYADDDSNDLSDLGIGSSDASSKAATPGTSDVCKDQSDDNQPSTNADLNEYTYEGAIEDYKSRISRTGHQLAEPYQRCESEHVQSTYTNTKQSVESSYQEVSKTSNEDKKIMDTVLPEVPKIDFLRRKELFEKDQVVATSDSETRRQSTNFVSTISIKERLSVLKLNHAPDPAESDKNQRTFPDVSFKDLKNRLEVFEREIRNISNDKDVSAKVSSQASPECSMEDQLNNNEDFESNATFIVKQMESLPSVEKLKDGEEFSDKSAYEPSVYNVILTQKQTSELDDNENMDTDREDSGIHTTDVSCSVSQADDQNEEVEHHGEEDGLNLKIETILPRDDCSEVQSFFKEDDRSVSFEDHGYTQADGDEVNDVNILDDALEMAFQEIDNMEGTAQQPSCQQIQEPIYQNICDIEKELPFTYSDIKRNVEIEPYYQVPKSQEPYYEVPKTKPIPLYENVEMLHSVAVVSDNDAVANDVVKFTIGLNNLQPPKEKPPPPPVENMHDGDDYSGVVMDNKDNFRRINSTKRIKKEIRNKRSSFLGIEATSVDDDGLLEFSLAPPLSNLQEEKNLEKQLLMKSGFYDNSDTAESRDSGVSENHSRQSSDLFTTSSDDPEDFIRPKVGEQKVLKFNEYGDHHLAHFTHNESFQQDIDDDTRHRTIAEQMREQENYDDIPHFMDVTYCNEQTKELRNAIPPPIPPAKPLRSPHYSQHQYNPYSEHRKSMSNVSNLDCEQLKSNTMSLSENQIAYHNACNNINALTRDFMPLSDPTQFCNNSVVTKNALEAVNTVPKPNPVNDWAPYRASYETNEFGSDAYPLHKNMLRQRSYTEVSPQWNIRPSRQVNKSSDAYNRHWFVQEAEQRRIEQQANIHHTSGFPQNKNANRKSLPESVIQTITQRVQNLGIGTDRRWQPEGPSPARIPTNESGIKPNPLNIPSHKHHVENDEKVLSVSGKKKCSHCNNELGRGAAMVIESLGLLYHIDCFKCCVCHTRLGDGFKGTDVRVRKYKLHCQNCFSSEDGVKFSCV